MNPYQTGFPRLIAVMIDNVVIGVAQTAFAWLLLQDAGFSLNLASALVYALMPLSYSVFMHGRFGQTLGKFICGVKVLTVSGARISYEHAIRRDILPFLLLPVGLWTITYFAIYREYPQSTIYPLAQQIGLFWGLLELVTMLFNEQRRALHDYIAKTVVVRVGRPFSS